MTEPLADRILQVVDESINSHLCTCEDECRPQRNRDAAVAMLRELRGHPESGLRRHGRYWSPERLLDLADEIEQGGQHD